MKTMSTQEIRDTIQQMDLTPSVESMNLLAEVIIKLTERMDRMEAAARRSAEVASCIANGIQPD